MTLTDADLSGLTAKRTADATACAGKERFRTAEAANAVRRRCRYGAKLDVFRCPRCGAWHLGGAKPRRARRPIGDLP